MPLTRSVLDVGDPDKGPKSKFIQEEPTNLAKGIEIQHLYKVSAHESPSEILPTSVRSLLFYSDGGYEIPSLREV